MSVNDKVQDDSDMAPALREIPSRTPSQRLSPGPAAPPLAAPTWLRLRRARLVSIGSVLAILGIWESVTASGFISPLFLPPLGEVGRTGWQMITSGGLIANVAASTMRVLGGFALAVLAGVPLGVLMAVWWPARAAFTPLISLLRPLPSITWIPLTMLWLGIGEEQKVSIVFLGSWIYVLTCTFDSARRVDPVLIRAAQNLGASGFVIMREVILPASLPGVMSGLRVTLAISWSCVLSAEMVAAPNGLGAMIWQAKDWDNLALVLLGMVCISVTVLLFDTLMNVLERILLPWERHRR